MKLGAPLQNDEGRVLLTEGTELSDQLLASLWQRSISCISILEEDARSDEVLAVEREKMTEHINAMFSKTEKTASLELLRQLILEYRIEPLL